MTVKSKPQKLSVLIQAFTAQHCVICLSRHPAVILQTTLDFLDKEPDMEPLS